MNKLAIGGVLVAGLAIGFFVRPDRAPADHHEKPSSEIQVVSMSGALGLYVPQDGKLYLYKPDDEKAVLRATIDVSKAGKDFLPMTMMEREEKRELRDEELEAVEEADEVIEEAEEIDDAVEEEVDLEETAEEVAEENPVE